jgi:hypothetical protein
MERKKVLRLFNLSDETQEAKDQLRFYSLDVSLASSCIAFKESLLTIMFNNTENYINLPYDSIETMAIFGNSVEIDTADGGHVSLDITQEQYLALLADGCSLNA